MNEVVAKALADALLVLQAENADLKKELAEVRKQLIDLTKFRDWFLEQYAAADEGGDNSL